MTFDSSTCRSCGETGLKPFLDLGKTPLADRMIRKDQLYQEEPVFPLEVVFCPSCSLTQILETVLPEQLFCEDYPYFSSVSHTLLEHSRKNALELIESRNLGPEDLVIELASNDGYLLKNYVEANIPVLGVDPAQGPAKAARKIGVDTVNEFFTIDFAKNLRDQERQADVLHANNVLAHVSDTNGFVEGIRYVLKNTGVAVIEAPYVRDLIDHCEFDTIYHEHLCYFSVTSLDKLFRRHGLFLNDIRRLSIHGGSLRLYVEPTENTQSSVTDILSEEENLGLTKLSYYTDFSSKVSKLKQDLLSLLTDLKRQSKSIAAYGAAAKGSTMINYVGVGTNFVDYVVDKNAHKHGLYMPGQHIPIRDTGALLEETPDYLLILAWNFADEIRQQQSEYIEKGGKFIIPVPSPHIT